MHVARLALEVDAVGPGVLLRYADNSGIGTGCPFNVRGAWQRALVAGLDFRLGDRPCLDGGAACARHDADVVAAPADRRSHARDPRVHLLACASRLCRPHWGFGIDWLKFATAANWARRAKVFHGHRALAEHDDNARLGARATIKVTVESGVQHGALKRFKRLPFAQTLWVRVHVVHIVQRRAMGVPAKTRQRENTGALVNVEVNALPQPLVRCFLKLLTVGVLKPGPVGAGAERGARALAVVVRLDVVELAALLAGPYTLPCFTLCGCALRCTEYAIASACFCGLPACISLATFLLNASLLGLLTSGIFIPYEFCGFAAFLLRVAGQRLGDRTPDFLQVGHHVVGVEPGHALQCLDHLVNRAHNAGAQAHGRALADFRISS